MERQLNRLEQARREMTIDRRKADTRRKIQLGGIVVKAGLEQIDAFALLGLLTEHAEALQHPGEQQRLRQIGREFAAATAPNSPISDAA